MLSYGVDFVDSFRRAATYVDRVLRGAKPGDLPVQLPTRFEMVVNRGCGSGISAISGQPAPDQPFCDQRQPSCHIKTFRYAIRPWGDIRLATTR